MLCPNVAWPPRVASRRNFRDIPESLSEKLHPRSSFGLPLENAGTFVPHFPVYP